MRKLLAHITRAYRAWRASAEEDRRLIELGAQIDHEGRDPETEEERRALAAYLNWLDGAW